MSGSDRLPVALLLPGQGSQYQGMGTGLYGQEKVFTEAVDEIFDLLGPDAAPVRADWLSDEPVLPIHEVGRAQVMLFVIDWAISRQLISWGVEPAAVLGHSAGELVAATLAGVFTLPDAVTLMWQRVARWADAPPGGMLAVAGRPDQIEPMLEGGVVVAIVNTPSQVIVAGPRDGLRRSRGNLESEGFTCRTVPATTGFHSPMLAEAVESMIPLVERAEVHPPRLAFWSGFTAGRPTAAELADPLLWAGHAVEPVLFWPALSGMLAEGDFRLVEAGPGRVLSTAARRHRSVAFGASTSQASMPARFQGQDAERAALEALAEALID